MNRIATIAAACALVFAGTAVGNEKQGDSHQGMHHETGASASADAAASADAQMAYSDETFMMKAASGGMAEVSAGKLASAKGNSDDVRQFGQKMVDDHTKNNAELKQLASKKGVDLPAAPDAKHQQAVAKLQSMTGDEFDRAYSAQMVKDHAEMEALLTRATKESKDADVKAFAQKTLAAVQQHHMMAEKLERTEMAEATND